MRRLLYNQPEEKGDNSVAIEQLVQYMSELPDSAWDNAVRGLLAQLYCENGDYDDAISLLTDVETIPANQMMDKIAALQNA